MPWIVKEIPKNGDMVWLRLLDTFIFGTASSAKAEAASLNATGRTLDGDSPYKHTTVTRAEGGPRWVVMRATDDPDRAYPIEWGEVCP